MPTIYDPFRDPETGAKPMAMIQSEFEAAQDRPAPALVRPDEKAEKARLEKSTEQVEKYNKAVEEAAERAADQLEEKRNKDEEEPDLKIVETPADKGDDAPARSTRKTAEPHQAAAKS